MRTRIPTLVTVELSDTFAYRSMCLPDVDDGLVGKPTPSFVFEVEDKIGREGIAERQGTRFATALRIADASDDIHTCSGLGYVCPPWNWDARRKICRFE
jgi:hypothetical protein